MAYLSLEALGVIISRTRSNRDIVSPIQTDARTVVGKTQPLPALLRVPYRGAPRHA